MHTAKKLGRAFIDTDRLIEEIYQQNTQRKLTCTEIYQESGPATFQALEYEVVQSLQDVQHSVISAGGSTMLWYENVKALQTHSHMYYLFCEKDKLKKRVFSENRSLPFLDPKDPEGSFDRLYEERDEFFRKLGTEIIDVTSMKEREIVDQLIKFAKVKDGK